MVYSKLRSWTQTCVNNTLQGQLFFPMSPSDVAVTYQVELDISDIFGPLSVVASNEVSNGTWESLLPGLDDDPVVIYHRSHSLVGPSACVSQSLNLSKVTLHETEDSIELVECIHDGTFSEVEVLHGGDSLVKDSSQNVNGDSMIIRTVSLEDFEVLKVVGQGAFGKVYQVRKKGTTEIYAMKVMQKNKIMEKNHAEYMKAERDILTKIEHPFIVQLRYSFQTKYRLYLVLDFVNGGHLFFQLYHHTLFREDLARIYAADIVSAVSYLHSNGIMHRDLKPENILLDADGHAMLTDFGLTKQFREDTRSNSVWNSRIYVS